MKIISFEKMLAMPVGTLFCLVDVPDDFAMGPLCRKEFTEGNTFDYVHVGSKVTLSEDTDTRNDFIDNACDTLKVDGVFRDAVLDEAAEAGNVYVEEIGSNPLCTFAVYEKADLQYMLAVMQESIDVLSEGIERV